MTNCKENPLDGFRSYPSLRDHPLKTADQWLKGRRIDDKLDGLWRVHDKLYDLTSFIDRHPGGKEWLELTKGTDITEAFESSHLNPSVQSLLDKFYVKPAQSERISPYTFEPNGFYATLKRRVYEELSTMSAEQKKSARQRVTLVQNRLLFTFGLLLIATALTDSYSIAVLAGIVLFLNINCAHNFFHQKNNWRMYGWDLGLLSSHEWRVTHGISHHGYTNTVMDIELAAFEPIIDFRVVPKNPLQRYLPLCVALIFGSLPFFVEVVKRAILIFSGQQKLRPENLLCLAQLAVLYSLSDKPFGLWLAIQASSSYFFVVIGIMVGHHHPDIFHNGDGQFQLGNDWGLAQLDAVRDRNDIEGNLLAELTTFGNHILHHLFPTLDHGLLDLLRPVLEKTCRDFNVPDELYKLPSYLNQFNMTVGMVRQVARIQPRKFAPPKAATSKRKSRR